MRFLKYMKTALLNRWNLLLLAGATGFALLSGRPDVWMPLVLAAEIGYAGMLASHPKFQRYVDAREAKAQRQVSSVGTANAASFIMGSLPTRLKERFESLRRRCFELRQIAAQLRGPHHLGEPLPLEESQSAGLDRLLWIFLRLLFTQNSLQRFLEQTDEGGIRADIERLTARLAKIPAGSEDSQRQKMRRTLEDNLQTCRDRLENYEKAASNYELVELELDRLENKIRSLSELAVNRQEPDFISGQVDQIASSMVQTERTMNDLQFVTGLQTVVDEPPPLLQIPLPQVTSRS